jgi:hypothetical protein
MTFEVHPGIYTSYEYTDNYYGEVRDAQGESIYYVGPSLRLSGVSSSANVNLAGFYARSFHHRFTEDDSPEVSLSSDASFAMTRQTARLAYEYTQTWSRENLDEPFGEHKRHTGNIGYTAELTQSTSLALGGDIMDETWDVPHEEVPTVSHQKETVLGGNLGITHHLTTRDTFTLTARQTQYDYEISPDVVETDGALQVSHAFTPSFSLITDIAYNHYSRETLTAGSGQAYGIGDEDRYDAILSGQYAFDRATTLVMGGGYSWLVMEGEDRETGYITQASLTRNEEKDRFTLEASKRISAEFTVDRYGNYDNTTASLMWERRWVEEWSTITEFSYDKEKPMARTPGQDETDYSGQFTLRWEPIRYLTASLIYNHLRTEYETTGTAQENRYRVVVEVRY